jgi:hypothetical protein
MAEKIYGYALPERLEKTERIVGSLMKGSGGQLLYDTNQLPHRGEGCVVVWGQIWASAEIMKKCAERGVDFYQIDNGYFLGARGKWQGYYRVTKNALVQNKILDRPADRFLSLGLTLKPYHVGGRNVVLAKPGGNYGRYKGLDLNQWEEDTKHLLSTLTQRKIYIRPKVKEPNLQDYLNGNNVHALVTHSSNAAVDALLEGYPVFCDAECAAAPVGNLDLKDIERPLMPDRTKWAHSLAYCQFTLEEFENGTAWRIIRDNDGL